MKLIINGKDVTSTTGEITEFRGEVLLPISFLEGLQNSGITVTKISSQKQSLNSYPKTTHFQRIYRSLPKKIPMGPLKPRQN